MIESVGNEDQMSIDNMQFGFMPGKGTTDTRERPSKEDDNDNDNEITLF